MFIEISPIQVHLQEAIKCRGEYIEIFGYNSKFDENAIDKSDNWKEYHTWCGAEGSPSNPSPYSRYLVLSNSLYVSLQTSVSGYSRYFKIRYKGTQIMRNIFQYKRLFFCLLLVIPSSARSQYNSDGIPYESSVKGQKPSFIMPGTVTTPTKSQTYLLANNTDARNLNETSTKRNMKKGF